MLYIENLSKHFLVSGPVGKISALDTINFSLNQGDAMLLYGLNGSGKTTLLKCIAGLLLPEQGNIIINNTARDPKNLHKDISLLKRVSFVSSIINEFYPRLSIKQNLEFFSYPFFNSMRETNNNINDLIDIFGLQEYRTRPFQNCSQGIKKRVSLIRGLINKPEILLIDEWDTTIDKKISDIFLNYIRKESKPAVLIFSSHAVSEHTDFFNKTAVLHKGTLLYEGEINKLNAKTRMNTLAESLESLLLPPNDPPMADQGMGGRVPG